MIQIDKKEECSGCYACFNVCPVNAIEMIKDEKGFEYPKVNEDKCTKCGLCTKICPILNNKSFDNKPKAFAVYNKNENVRLKSSSGGIFTLLSEKIIDKKGYVYGAAWDKNKNVHHICINAVEDLSLLRGSKYLQSRIKNTYKDAEEKLKNGDMVYFSGTPCQIEGLKSYLRKEYDNLYTQDLICHGVPSEKVNQKYLEFLEKKYDSKVKEIEHRSKVIGWKKFSMNVTFENGEKHTENLRDDVYMKAFLRNTSLREACYNCVFKKKNRISDFTLADFWGIENVFPELDDDKGISLLIINSDKGMKLFEDIKANVVYKEIDFETAIKFNKNMTTSEKPDKNRKKFFENLEKISFDKLVEKYTDTPSILKKVVGKAKRVVKKIIRK